MAIRFLGLPRRFEVASLQERFIIEPRGPILHLPTNHCKATSLPSSVLSGGLGVLYTRGLADAIISSRLRLLLGRGRLVQRTDRANGQPLEVL